MCRSKSRKWVKQMCKPKSRKWVRQMCRPKSRKWIKQYENQFEWYYAQCEDFVDFLSFRLVKLIEFNTFRVYIETFRVFIEISRVFIETSRVYTDSLFLTTSTIKSIIKKTTSISLWIEKSNEFAHWNS